MFSTFNRLHLSRFPSGWIPICNVLWFCIFSMFGALIFFVCFSINHSFECAIFYFDLGNCISHPYPYFVTLKCLLLPSVAVHHVLLLHLVVGLCIELTHLSQSSSHPRLAAILLVLLSWFCPDFSKAIFLMVICEGCLMLFNIIQDFNYMHFLFLVFKFSIISYYLIICYFLFDNLLWLILFGLHLTVFGILTPF